MKMLKALTFAVIAVAMGACSQQKQPSVAATGSDRVLTVKQYYADDAARSAAIDRCSSTNEGQVNANLQKPECKNALQAENLHQLGMKPE